MAHAAKMATTVLAPRATPPERVRGAAPVPPAPRVEDGLAPDPEADPLGEVELAEDPEVVAVPLPEPVPEPGAGAVPGFMTSNCWEVAKIWVWLVPLTKLTT